MALDRQSYVYFGYGSNMWLDQMVRRCPESEFLGIAILKDWKWIICERGYANIIQFPGNNVYGLVYHISESDEKALDGFEGVPNNYTKEYPLVTFLGKKEQSDEEEMKALVYIDHFRTKEGPPRTEYIYRMNMAIVDAIKEGVPEAYIDEYLRKFIHRN